MWIVKSNVSSVQVSPSSERNKFHACFSLTKDLCSKPQGTQLWRLPWHSLCAMRGNTKLETPDVFCARWMCVTLTESWGDKTCRAVVIWTRRNWQLVEHPRCDKRREGREHANGENTRGEKAREGRKEKTRILSPLISLARVSVPRSVLSHAECSVVSAFSERHAHSRCTEERRCFKFQITAHCKFNMKHHIKHTEDYHRGPRVELPPSKR